jgi:hypothetical protein
VPDFCTCGAQLPEDARFCHKCGKPQREEPVFIEEEPPPIPQPAIPVPVPIGFNNRMAVWIALRVGILAFLAFLVTSVAGAFALVWPVVGGFFAVYLYRKRTGERLSIVSGARLGWLAGIFGFVLITILLTLAIVALSEPEFVQRLRDQWKARSLSDADINLTIEFMRSPSGVVALLLGSFFLFTLLPAFGGAVGAKLLDRESSPPN